MHDFSADGHEGPWLIRTDFSDQSAWEAVCDGVARACSPDTEESAADMMGVVDDSEFEGLTPAGLLAIHPFSYAVYFLVDHLTVTDPEQPLLAVDVLDEPGRTFRLIPSELPLFADNMLISNMDFADFADGVGPDGVFRGFGSPSQRMVPSQVTAEPAPAPDDPPGPESATDANSARDESIFATSIELGFGQRWPGDTRPARASDIRMMKWDEPES